MNSSACDFPYLRPLPLFKNSDPPLPATWMDIAYYCSRLSRLYSDSYSNSSQPTTVWWYSRSSYSQAWALSTTYLC